MLPLAAVPAALETWQQEGTGQGCSSWPCRAGGARPWSSSGGCWYPIRWEVLLAANLGSSAALGTMELKADVAAAAVVVGGASLVEFGLLPMGGSSCASQQSSHPSCWPGLHSGCASGPAFSTSRWCGCHQCSRGEYGSNASSPIAYRAWGANSTHVCHHHHQGLHRQNHGWLIVVGQRIPRRHGCHHFCCVCFGHC